MRLNMSPPPIIMSRAQTALLIFAIATVYFLAAKFGFLMAFATKQVTAVWPPTGIALVAYLLFGFRVWPGVFIGAFLINVISNEPTLTAIGIAAGNTLAGIGGIMMLRSVVDFNLSLTSVKDILGLAVFGAGVGCVISATNGVAQLALAGIIPWSAYSSVWWVWWMGDTMGVLLVAPLLLTWLADQSLIRNFQKLGEALLLFLCLIFVCEIALSGKVISGDSLFRIEYAVFPLIIWAALRFGQREVALVVFLISGFAIWGAIHDRGPFAIGTLDQRLMLLELFMAVTTMTGLILATAIREQRYAETALKIANADLENRVKERTAQLAITNKELAQKNEEVEAFVYIVSHDLRAPLVNLQGFSRELAISCRDLESKLLNKSLPVEIESAVRAILMEDIPSSLRYITASSTKFERLINALLELSRHGRQTLRSLAIDMDELVSSTLDTLKESIRTRNIHISVTPLPAALGDRSTIDQVFANLIGNAIKYLQPERLGEIEIGGVEEGDMNHYWIRDNGVGIPTSAHGRLFQVFQRFHPKMAEGEGMGLVIVKRIVEKQGGRIWVESTENVGTTFHLTLTATLLNKEN